MEPRFRWQSSLNDTLAVLREQRFDLVLLFVPSDSESSSTEKLDLVRAMRTSGHDDPVVIVGYELADAFVDESFHLNCELISSNQLWDCPSIVAAVQKAVAQVDICRENQRLGVAHQRRSRQDHGEAIRLLEQQQRLVSRHSGDETESFTGPDQARESIERFYDELVRTFVIMGSGSLEREIDQLAELLVDAGFSPRDALQMHLRRVEHLVEGLGHRSGRHVMSRVDLLALELMTKLAERFYANQI